MSPEAEWTRRTPADWPELVRSPRAIIAQWVGTGSDITLYEDGQVEVVGMAPVELLAHVGAEWHNWLRGRVA